MAKKNELDSLLAGSRTPDEWGQGAVEGYLGDLKYGITHPQDVLGGLLEQAKHPLDRMKLFGQGALTSVANTLTGAAPTDANAIGKVLAAGNIGGRKYTQDEMSESIRQHSKGNYGNFKRATEQDKRNHPGVNFAGSMFPWLAGGAGVQGIKGAGAGRAAINAMLDSIPYAAAESVSTTSPEDYMDKLRQAGETIFSSGVLGGIVGGGTKGADVPQGRVVPESQPRPKAPPREPDALTIMSDADKALKTEYTTRIKTRQKMLEGLPERARVQAQGSINTMQDKLDDLGQKYGPIYAREGLHKAPAQATTEANKSAEAFTHAQKELTKVKNLLEQHTSPANQKLHEVYSSPGEFEKIKKMQEHNVSYHQKRYDNAKDLHTKNLLNQDASQSRKTEAIRARRVMNEAKKSGTPQQYMDAREELANLTYKPTEFQDLTPMQLMTVRSRKAADLNRARNLTKPQGLARKLLHQTAGAYRPGGGLRIRKSPTGELDKILGQTWGGSSVSADTGTFNIGEVEAKLPGLHKEMPYEQHMKDWEAWLKSIPSGPEPQQLRPKTREEFFPELAQMNATSEAIGGHEFGHLMNDEEALKALITPDIIEALPQWVQANKQFFRGHFAAPGKEQSRVLAALDQANLSRTDKLDTDKYETMLSNMSARDEARQADRIARGEQAEWEIRQLTEGVQGPAPNPKNIRSQKALDKYDELDAADVKTLQNAQWMEHGTGAEKIKPSAASPHFDRGWGVSTESAADNWTNLLTPHGRKGIPEGDLRILQEIFGMRMPELDPMWSRQSKKYNPETKTYESYSTMTPGAQKDILEQLDAAFGQSSAPQSLDDFMSDQTFADLLNPRSSVPWEQNPLHLLDLEREAKKGKK